MRPPQPLFLPRFAVSASQGKAFILRIRKELLITCKIFFFVSKLCWSLCNIQLRVMEQDNAKNVFHFQIEILKASFLFL